ncbi:Glutamyl-tRNA amidotransferase subunit A, mitochondrial [Sordaria brevicollis]|uniref:Glutamyl-tRNA(Gln) amidotransferase subunit A, mitochondrial n=1 Tax=Sordaria brevicollis TaxID=83679 RepID=A0AAE0P8Z8_SORBR|nr:Glutamyl-tRNA amidotransferase subunit A, mitochondrial [Sordaria brevicollis]
MSARTGRLRGLCLRHVSSTRQTSHTQRRFLNQFISRVQQNDQPALEQRQFRLAVKDNIATVSPNPEDETPLTTTCGSNFLANYRSPFEATIVTQLRSRGAVLVGKTNLDEFGMGSHSVHTPFGVVAQEHDEQQAVKHSAGGSSGGSAVSIATGEADIALGTDTGGSVRLPAAYTGVVGFKPSYGMISRYGVVPYANSLDTVGILAKEVRPITELILGSSGETKGLWAEHDPLDPTSLSPGARRRCASQRDCYNHTGTLPKDPYPLKGLKFGLPLEYNITELSPSIRAAWSAAAAKLQSLGARLVPVSLPSTRHALSAYYVIAPAEASSNLAKYDGIRYGTRFTSPGESDAAIPEGSESEAEGILYARARAAGFGDEVKRRILLGAYTLSSAAMDNYFLKAQKVRRLVRRDFNRVFALPNPLLDKPESFELSELPETVGLEDKWGPTEVDFLLCPTAPTTAPKLEEVLSEEEKDPVSAYMNDVFTVPASLAGLPAISVPMKVQGDQEGTGMAGLQLIGQYWDDARLLAVAQAVSTVVKEEL